MVLLEILFCVLPLLAKDFFRGTVKKGPIIREYHRHRAGPQSRRKRKTHEKQYRSANNTQNTAESFFPLSSLFSVLWARRKERIS
jgi:ribosomal protein S21